MHRWFELALRFELALLVCTVKMKYGETLINWNSNSLELIQLKVLTPEDLLFLSAAESGFIPVRERYRKKKAAEMWSPLSDFFLT